jgi:aminotransferase
VRAALPDFPWDVLLPLKKLAMGHPGGIVNLALGTPVDPTPQIVQDAFRAAANAPGHPSTEGTPQMRAAAAGYLRRRLGVTVQPDAVLPVIGTKELIAWLPTLLGIGPGDSVAFPALSFPTYDVSARLAGARPLRFDGIPDERSKLVWLNSPSNPDGRVLSAEELRKIVEWARANGTIVVNDECYIEHGWDAEPVSILHPDVCGVSHEGLLAVHSLSKRSNMAGYRAGFVAGDQRLVTELIEVRKHGGLIVPTPTLAAMSAALDDDRHVDLQRERYERRRVTLREALSAHGFRVEHSAASLFLWVTRDEPGWDSVKDLAGLGILGTPGSFYGTAGHSHVRIAITATDERVEAAVARLVRR